MLYFIQRFVLQSQTVPGVCFSKDPKLFGPISGLFGPISGRGNVWQVSYDPHVL